MHESANQGLEWNGRDADIRESRISRISVEGYDTSLRREDVDGALRQHFAPCGNIIHVYVPINDESDILCRYALIYVNEEDEEKALRLNGSDMGGQILKVKSYPFHENHLNDVLDPMKEDNFFRPQRTMMVTGYDTSLPVHVIETQLKKYFSSRGSFVYKDASGAINTPIRVYVLGQEGIEKALERSGRSAEGLNFVVTEVVPFQKPIVKTGYRHPHNLTILTKEQIEAPNIYFVYDKTETTAGNQKKKKKKKKSKTTERKRRRRRRRSVRLGTEIRR